MNEDCPICLKQLKKSGSTKTSCGHSFHEQCLTTWFMTSNTCPMCRTKLEESNEDALKIRNTYDEATAYNDRIMELNIKIYYPETVNETVDNLIEVLGEPQRRIREWLDETRIEWDYQTRAGDVVTIQGHHIYHSTTDYELFHAEGYNWFHCRDSIDEIQSLLNEFYTLRYFSILFV